VTTISRAYLFLALSVLCYFTAAVLFFLQENILRSIPVNQITSFISRLYIPALLLVIVIVLFNIYTFLYLHAKGERSRCAEIFMRIASLTRYSFLLLIFLYTLFPFSWTKIYFARSHDSFPDATPFTFALQLLILCGTVFICLYCFDKLPLGIVNTIERAVSCFFSWRETRFIGALIFICMLATGLIAYVVLNHIPHVQDSIAQLFQAKIFKMGKLYAQLPPHKEFFDYTNIINDGKWYSQYPPGHSLLLMIGLFLGVPWLVNPLLGACSLLIFFLFLKTIYQDRQTPYVSTSLLLLSPFFLFMSSNHMNHSSTMFFILLFLYGYARLLSSQSSLYGVLAGVSLGYAITIRPLDAMSISIPFIGNLFFSAYHKRNIDIKKILNFFSGILLMIILLLLYNTVTNGNPFLFGYMKKYSTLGFLGGAQVGPSHTLKGGIVNTSNNLISLNQYLFEWPIPSLFFIFILFAIPVKKNRWDYLFLLASLMPIGGYFFYYYQDLCFGPRFYYCVTPFMIVLTARGFLSLPLWFEKKFFDRRRTEALLYLVLFLCFFYTFVFSLPSLIKKYSNDYWGVTDRIHNAVKEQGITNALIFIDVWYGNPTDGPNLIPYGSGFQFNSPDLNDDVIYAMDLRGKNRDLMDVFPGRNYYLCKFHKPMRDFTLIKLNALGNN